MVLSGAADHFNLTSREIAIISGSHGGERIHLETVLSILSKCDLAPEQLQCGVQFPLDSKAHAELISAGEQPTELHHNCSGKHAGMLATASHLGTSMDDYYLDPSHEIQQQITRLIGRLGEISQDDIRVGIDGCSAPVHALPMYSAALSFARLVDPAGLPADYSKAINTVTESMRLHPEMVAATRNRICTELIRAAGKTKLIAKAGAEGYYTAAWIDPASSVGIGLSVKIEDGSQRGRDPLVIAILQKFGVLPAELPEKLKPFASGDILNFRGIKVGEVVVRI